MRIAHVCPLYYPVIGGGQSHAKELSESLVRRGHEVTVLTQNCSDGHTPLGSSLLPDAEVVNGVAVKRFTPLLPPRKLLRVRGSGLVLRTMNSDYLNMWAEGPHMPGLVAEIVRAKPELVTVFNWYVPAIPYHVRLARTMARFALTGIPLFHTEEDWAHRRVQRRTLRQCDAVLVNTEYEGRFVRSLAPEPRVHVVGVGITPADFADPRGSDIRARHGLGNAPVVGFVGKMIPEKGVDTLAQAMKIVWKTDARVRLVLAGPLGLSEAERQAGDRLLGDLTAEEISRVTHIGPFADDDKSSIFDAFDIFAMPSTGESFGIAYLEAWMCKKPVIGSRTGAISCVIRDEIDGLLVNPEDPESLASAILDLVRDPKKRQRLGQAGYEKTLAQFTWDKITDKVENVYSAIAAQPKPVERRHLGPEAL